MGDIGKQHYSNTGTSQKGKVTAIVSGSYAAGGSKIGKGGGKLKKKMVWKDTGRQGSY